MDIVRKRNIDFSVTEYLQWMFKERSLDIGAYFKRSHMERVREVNQ